MYESYINKIEDVGKLRNLKPGTIRIYKNNVTQFLEFIQKHIPLVMLFYPKELSTFLLSTSLSVESRKEFSF